MAAATAAVHTQMKKGDIFSYGMSSGVTIYKGTLVSLSDGYAQAASDTASEVFVGVAMETKTESTSSDGGTDIKVHRTGLFRFAKTSAAVTDIGTIFCITDDQTVAADTTNDIVCGKCAGIDGTTHIWLDIADRTTTT